MPLSRILNMNYVNKPRIGRQACPGFHQDFNIYRKDDLKMIAAQAISLKKAIIVIVVFTVALIALGFFVGYRFYWNQYDNRPQVVKNEETFKAQVRANPKDVNAVLNLGWTYYEEGKYEKALAQYKKALKIDKGNIGAMYNIGLVYMDMKKYGEAEKELLKLLKKAPLHELGNYTLAQVYRKSKQYDKAIEQYNKTLKITPAQSNIITELGQTYEAKGMKKEAAQAYRDALKYVPDLKEAKEGLARLGTE